LLPDHPWQEGDAKACCDQFDHEIHLAAPRHDIGLEPRPPACVEDDAMKAEAALENDEGGILQLGKANRIACCKRVAGRQQRHQRFLLDGLPVKLLGHRQQGAREVDLAGPQRVLQLVAAMLHQPYLDARIALPVEGEERREQRAAADRRQAEPENTAPEATNLVDLGQKVVAVGQQLHAAPIDDLARRGKHAAMADPVEQRKANLFFEVLHRLADRGLRGEDGLGGLGEAALTDDFDESAEWSKFHN